MEADDCHFLLLGKTGVGKSTLSKILSENENIKIGDTMEPQTNEINSYKCQIDDFKFSIIDTPGYDDNPQKDIQYYNDIKELLSSQNYKIKGIFYVFSFQDTKFSDSHRKGFQKIINLIPLDNFWDYFTIIFTKTFVDEEDDLEEIKKEKLKNLEQIFVPLISAYNKSKNINLVEFSEIKKVFVNLKKNKTKKTDKKLKNLLNIFKNNCKLSPLFHKLEIEDKEDQIFILDKENKNKGKLYQCKIKIYKYYNNENNEPIKRIWFPDKTKKPKFIKEITKTEYDGKFQRNCQIARKASVISFIGSWVGCFSCGIGSIFFPPLAIGSVIFWCTGVGSWFGAAGSSIAAGIKNNIEENNNSEFNRQNVVTEEEIIKEIENDF